MTIQDRNLDAPRSVLPEFLLDGDARWVVGRAWPTSRGGLSLELTHPRSEHVRAAFRGPDAGDPFALHAVAADPSMTALAQAPGTIVVHRWMRRAVVRSPGGERYTKFLSRGRAERAGRLSHSFAELGDRAGFLCPAVLEAGEDRVVTSALGGETFARRGAQAELDLGEWVDLWGAWSESWMRLVRGSAGPRSGATMALHDAGAEARVLAEWVSHVLRHDALPGMEGTLTARCERVTSALRSGTGHRLGVAHRDLHDKQLLAEPGSGRVGLLDFDTAAIAEPALDLANLLVHLDWRHRQGMLGEDRVRSARAIVLRTAERLQVPDERLDAYAQATALRLACVYAFRPRWALLARAWLTDNGGAPACRNSTRHAPSASTGGIPRKGENGS